MGFFGWKFKCMNKNSFKRIALNSWLILFIHTLRHVQLQQCLRNFWNNLINTLAKNMLVTGSYQIFCSFSSCLSFKQPCQKRQFYAHLQEKYQVISIFCFGFYYWCVKPRYRRVCIFLLWAGGTGLCSGLVHTCFIFGDLGCVLLEAKKVPSSFSWP